MHTVQSNMKQNYLIHQVLPQNGPERKGNKEILHPPQISKTEALQ